MTSATCSKVKESIYLNQDVLRVLKKEREREGLGVRVGEGERGRESERERENSSLVSYSELQ